MTKKIQILCLLLLLSVVQPVFACTLSFTGTTISFGNYNPFSITKATGALTFTTNCANTPLASDRIITLSTGASNSFSNRTMGGNGYDINYNLFTNLANSSIWGDGTGGSVSVTAGMVDGESHVIYASIPAEQDAMSGPNGGIVYSDNILVSIGNGADSENISLNTQVPQLCQFVSGNLNLNFGNYDPIVANAASPLDATSNLTVKCTSGSDGITIGMGDGLHLDGSQRRMQGNYSNYLNYEIYKPNSSQPGASCAYTAVWGSGVGQYLDLDGVAPSFSGSSYNICGRIPAHQTSATADTYTDQVQIQVNY